MEAARAGSQRLLDIGLGARPAEFKARGDYVTQADRESEHAIMEVLARLCPGVSILAEETGGTAQPTMWAVDPLDGTTNYSRGIPVAAVSVALIEAGQPVLGVIIAPWLGLEFSAARGRGAELNGVPLPPLGPGDPERSVLATGFPFRRRQRLPQYLPLARAALDRFEDLRRTGSAALDLAWTASGSLDGYFELDLRIWDLAAGALLVQEVGGHVTDWSGGQAWTSTGDVLAAPAAVHEVLLELAREPAQG